LILDAEPGATLGMGTLRPLSGEALRETSLSGEIETLMDWKPVKTGDFFYIPAGTVHAIGAGVTLVEVQQNVDVTYRLYDYGRPRELHLDDGVAVSLPAPYSRPATNIALLDDAALLDRSEAPFALGLETFDIGEAEIGGTGQSWFIPLTGHGTIDGQPWEAGQCWLIEGSATLAAAQSSRALLASL
jgi:mannose-6-phosphate isomerase